MNAFKKGSLIIILIVLAVFVIGGLYFYTHYEIINGNIVSQNERTYIDYEKSIQDSYNKGDVNGAVDYARSLKTLGVDDERADLTLAQALLNKGSLTFDENTNTDQAIALLNGILAKNPSNVEVLSTMGYAYEIKQDYKRAFDYYGRALALDPADDLTYVRRGHAYELSGDYASAQADYIKAYDLDPTQDTTLMNLARMYYATGDYEESITFANKALDITQNSYVRAVSSELIGQAAVQNSEYALAQQYFDYAITSDPSYPGPYLQAAYVDVIQSDTASSTAKVQLLADASADVDSALALHQGSAFAYVIKGLIAGEQGDTKGAKEYYTKALSMIDGDITLGALDKQKMRDQIANLIK